MARTGVRLRRLTAAGLTVAAATVVAGRAAGDVPDGTDVVVRPVDHSGSRYVVRSGDTVWGIARARVGPREDPRPMVAAIRRANGLDDPTIRPGMALVIPPAPG